MSLINLQQLGEIFSDIGNKLVLNQTILKAIKYNDPSALSHPNVSYDDIIKLIGQGNDPKTEQRIFKTPFHDNIVDEVRNELRFFTPTISPEHAYLANLILSFQIVIHNSLWDLDDGQIRPFVLMQEILKEFNGYNIGIGILQLNRPIQIATWNKNFSGYELIFRTRMK